MRHSVEPVFKALADPTRRGIFERLTRDGEQTVHALTQAGSVSQPMVSKHLAALKRARLVRARHTGRETHYSAQPRALAPLVDWMNYYSRFWNDRFGSLEDLLKRMDP
jgi:DNA-binding transcriptional ArsR family regulator